MGEPTKIYILPKAYEWSESETSDGYMEFWYSREDFIRDNGSDEEMIEADIYGELQ